MVGWYSMMNDTTHKESFAVVVGLDPYSDSEHLACQALHAQHCS